MLLVLGPLLYTHQGILQKLGCLVCVCLVGGVEPRKEAKYKSDTLQ